jgi:predicted ThiF/HesA family dinucleotide-utilizing enzyme
MQIHRGGPARILAIDGQKVSPDDLIFRMAGADTGEYKVSFLERLAGSGFSREVSGEVAYVYDSNVHTLISGNVVCIEIAGGDTLPVTSRIIRHAQDSGAATISTMGVFGLADAPVSSVRIEDADPDNPIVAYLLREGIRNHTLVGTGKLIRDWEPVLPTVLDRVSQAIVSEILRMLQEQKIGNMQR